MSNVQYHQSQAFDAPTRITVERFAEEADNGPANLKFALFAVPVFIGKAGDFANFFVIFVEKTSLCHVFVGRSDYHRGDKILSQSDCLPLGIFILLQRFVLSLIYDVFSVFFFPKLATLNIPEIRRLISTSQVSPHRVDRINAPSQELQRVERFDLLQVLPK